MAKAYLVNHTHWDREWYFTACDALMLSDQLFIEVLDELEKNPKANFVMDGQSSIVDDFVEIHPECIENIKRFVSEGRLFIGPWYTQTDGLYVDGESILRNLMVGIRDTQKKYGKPMLLGYLPDTFGFSPAIHSIFSQVGIDSLLHWRGSNFDRLAPSPYYLWEGVSGKQLIGVNFPHGYMTALVTNEVKEQVDDFVKRRYDPEVDLLVSKGNNPDVLMPCGMDQKNIVRNIHKFVEELNKISKHDTVLSTYPEFVQVLRDKKDTLPVYKGELRLPSYSRVHRTIGSVRTQFKLNNFKLEQKIIRRIEPLMIIASKNQIKIGQEVLVKAWKKLFENQAHDSLGGCVSDNVALDIVHRYKEIEEILDGIENTIMKKMADALCLAENEIILVNTDPHEFKGEMKIHVVAPTKNIVFTDVKDPEIYDEKYYPVRHNIVKQIPTGVELIDEPAYYELWIKGTVTLPPMGYKIISYEQSQDALAQPSVVDNVSEVSNNIYVIKFVDNHLVLKYDGKEFVDFIELVDASNMGDTYDYSPMQDEQEKVLAFNNVKVEEVHDKKIMHISGKSLLPATLADRLAENPQMKEVDYTLTITLGKTADLLNCDLVVNNTVESHRMRIKMNTEIFGNESYAQIQNAFTKNINFDIPDNWKDEFVEKPVNINFLDKSVSVICDEYAVNLYSEGLREYQKEDKYLYLTLMATTGELGKPDLAWRPGRASGDTTNQGHIMMQTPMAQELGVKKYSFSFEFSKQFDEYSIAKKTYELLHQSISYQKQTLNVFINRLDNKIWPIENSPKINRNDSFLSISKNYIISALYPSYLDDNSYIVRVVNPTNKTIRVDEDLLKNGVVVNALEEVVEFNGNILPYDMITLKYTF